jgi:hypothetical protein
MLEKELEAKCVKIARDSSCLLLKLSPQYCPGLPDRLLVCESGNYLLEFKRAGGRLTAVQNNMFRKISDAGGAAYVVDSIDKFCEVLDIVKALPARRDIFSL